MRTKRIRNLEILFIALICIIAFPINAEASETPKSGTLTIYNRSPEDMAVSGVEYTLWQVDESTGVRPGSASAAKEQLLAETKQIKTTDNEGMAVFSYLPIGLYYVEETSSEAGNGLHNQPFLVDVPMTNEEGTGWTTDVEVFLKNQTISIDKFVNAAGNEHYDTVKINNAKHKPVAGKEKFGFSVVSYVPESINKAVGEGYRVSAANGESYIITDSLTKDIIPFPETLKAYLIKSRTGKHGDGLALTEGKHYIKSYDKETNTIIIELTEEGLALADFEKPFLLVKYDCSLSDEARHCVDLCSGAKVVYTQSSGESLSAEVAEEPEVHTGQIKINKIAAENEAQPLKNAEFGIAVSKEDAQKGNFIADGKTDENGNLIFRGLSYGQVGDSSEQNSCGTGYWLTEVKAPEGYIRIEEPIEVKFQYQKDENGESYFANVVVHNELKAGENPSNSTPPDTQDKAWGSKRDFVKTGDTFAVWILTGVLIVSAIVFLLVLKRRNRNENKNN